MKKLIFIRMCGIMMLFILSSALVWAQNPPKKPMEKTKMTMDETMPYKAEYSSKFEMGKAAWGKLILDLWKDWDDNMFDRHANMFADTVVMYFPNGQMAKGKDSVLAGAKRYRGTIAAAKSTVEAWIPLRSIDKNENWVAIWGSEEDTWKDGKKTMVGYQEIWRINKDGKIDFMRQYETKIPPPGQQ